MLKKFLIWFCHTLSGANQKQWYTFLIHVIGNNNNPWVILYACKTEMDRRKDTPETNIKITTIPMVIPSQIVDLYVEIICKKIGNTQYNTTQR